jgi:hypothetical protein
MKLKRKIEISRCFKRKYKKINIDLKEKWIYIFILRKETVYNFSKNFVNFHYKSLIRFIKFRLVI